jgi:hypothetical protein
LIVRSYNAYIIMARIYRGYVIYDNKERNITTTRSSLRDLLSYISSLEYLPRLSLIHLTRVDYVI